MDVVKVPAAILSGLLLAQWIAIPLWVWLLLFIVLLISGIIARNKGAVFMLEQPIVVAATWLLLGAMFCLGGIRASWQTQQTSEDDLQYFNQKGVISFNAYVARPPEVRRGLTHLVVKVQSNPAAKTSPQQGMALLRVRNNPSVEFHYGDCLQIIGIAQTPADADFFSYRDYLDRQGISTIIYNPGIEKLPETTGNPLLAWIYSVREELLQKVYRLYPLPESSLMAGILLGDETLIPSDVKHAFQITGTTHVIAISGANFAVLVWLINIIVLQVIKRWWAPFVSIPFIIAYGVMVGGQPAVIRAVIMSVISLIGYTIGRRKEGLSALLLSATIMGFWNPQVVFDSGFQLSFSATLGIILFLNPLRSLVGQLLSRLNFMNPTIQLLLLNLISDFCLVTISAQVFVFFISAALFNRVSLITLLANFFIAPFQSISMIGGMLSLLGDFIAKPLGLLIARLVWAAPGLTIRIVEKFAESPWASFYWDFSIINAWLIIALVSFFVLTRTKWIKKTLQNQRVVLVIILTSAALFCWGNSINYMDRRLRIQTNLNHARPSLHLQTPEHQVLVIAENQTNYSAQSLFEVTSFFEAKPSVAAIDFEQRWMEEAFLERNNYSAELVLNNKKINDSLQYNSGIDMNLGMDYSIFTDEVKVQSLYSFLKKHAWRISFTDLHVLIPMGLSPDHLIKNGLQNELLSASVILLGAADNVSDWEEMRYMYFCQQSGCNEFPIMINTVSDGEFTLYSDGHQIWLYGTE